MASFSASENLLPVLFLLFMAIVFPALAYFQSQPSFSSCRSMCLSSGGVRYFKDNECVCVAEEATKDEEE